MELIDDPKVLQKTLVSCIERHAQIWFATAWASADTDFYRCLLANEAKIKKGVIGIHFFQTDPEVLDDFVASKRVRFMLQPSGVFHPKTLVFGSKGQWDTFIGSANLTKGGLGRNAELTVRLSSDDDDDKAACFHARRAIESWFGEAETMEEEQARRYRAVRPARQSALERAGGSYGGKSRKSPLSSSVSTLSWPEYHDVVTDTAGPNLASRLDVLAHARREFAQAPSFLAMSEPARRMIAGLPTPAHPESGWFGSMKGAGKLWTAMNQHLGALSDALDCVPLDGDVGRRHYDAYIANYLRAFPEGRHGIGTATRFLALKRPDQFVCLDNANRKALGKDFGIPISSMSYARYWDEIVLRIRDAPWWLAPPPGGGQEIEVWQGRAAMLDALFYEES
jgi:HKD family nuclease